MPKNRLSPHDRYARAMFKNKKVAREFFESHLPKKILKKINFSSLTPQPESFIVDKLRMQIADLLYSVTFDDKPGYLYVLMEHASKPDKLLPFRMLKYTTAVMDNHIQRTKDDTLPVVYPLILYTGDKPYRHSTNIYDLFGKDKQLAREIYTRPYDLVDLTQYPDEVLKKYRWFGAVAMLMKHIRDPDVLIVLENVLELLQRLENEGEFLYIHTSITYLFEAGEVKDKDKFISALKSGFSQIEDNEIMKIAEQFRQEGKQQGIQQGIKEGEQAALKKVVLNFLKSGLTLEQVAEGTNLPVNEVEEIRRTNYS